MSSTPSPDDEPTYGTSHARFSELLNHLFTTRQKTTPDGRKKRYTLREVADATGISIGFLSEARRGGKENPPKEFISLLADFFDVQPGFFFGPRPGESEAAPLEPEPVTPSLRQIMLRASTYSEVERELLLDWMDSVDRAMGQAIRSQREARNIDWDSDRPPAEHK